MRIYGKYFTRIILSLFLLVFTTKVSAQLDYSIPPMKELLKFYENGKSFHVLNDSLKASLIRLTDSTFTLRVHRNDLVVQECACIIKAKEADDPGLPAAARRLKLRDEHCLDFLPPALIE